MEEKPEEALLTVARLQEKMERWDDMLKASSEAIKLNPIISDIDREIFVTACKNSVRQHRASLQQLLVAEEETVKKFGLLCDDLKEQNLLVVDGTVPNEALFRTSVPEVRDIYSGQFEKGSVLVELVEESENSLKYNALLVEAAVDYRRHVEGDFRKICQLIMEILSDYLLPNTSDIESQVLFWKMLGDHGRYILDIELRNEGPKANRSENEALWQKICKSRQDYETAFEICKLQGISVATPLWLGLAKNYSVFCDEILEDRSMAINFATKSLDEAIASMHEAREEDSGEIMLSLQILNGNINRWKNRS